MTFVILLLFQVNPFNECSFALCWKPVFSEIGRTIILQFAVLKYPGCGHFWHFYRSHFLLSFPLVPSYQIIAYKDVSSWQASSALHPCHSFPLIYMPQCLTTCTYCLFMQHCHGKKDNWLHWNTESADDWWVSVTKSSGLQIWAKIVLIDGTCAAYLSAKYKNQPSVLNKLTGLFQLAQFLGCWESSISFKVNGGSKGAYKEADMLHFSLMFPEYRSWYTLKAQRT